MRFANIDQQGLTCPAAAPVLAGPPTGREIGKQRSQGFKGWSGCDQGIVLVERDVFSRTPTADIGH
eukprot:3040483-Alexandrium_andersonii.AAC.1